MTDGSEWDMKIWWPEVEHVTRGRSPSMTSLTEGSPISMSYDLSYDQQDFLQDSGVSESFTHKMAAWKICLQDGGNAAFLRVLPTRWRRGRFAYEMAAFLRSLPTICRRGNFAYKMAAFLRVLPTRWRWQTKRKQKQHRQNLNKNNVEYLQHIRRPPDICRHVRRSTDML